MNQDSVYISQPRVTDEEIDLVLKVLRSGHLVEGERVEKLEQVVSQFCHTKYGVAVNSGTAALHCALHAIGVGPGDEVITTPFTFVATANAIIHCGAKVVFADVNPSDYNINPDEVGKKITSKTKAIIAVDLFGQPADYRKLRFSKKITIIEDAAQSIGAKYYAKSAGNLADVATFSFYATKNIMCGEGGMVVTNSEKIANKCRIFRNHGQSTNERYHYLEPGFNYRLTDLLAAIAIPQVSNIRKITLERQFVAKQYYRLLHGIEGIELPLIRSNVEHCFHQFTIKVTPNYLSTREKLVELLKTNNIFPGIYYPSPLHIHPQFKILGYKEGDFPVSEKLSEQVLSLPVHPGVTIEQVQKIAQVIKQIKIHPTAEVHDSAKIGIGTLIWNQSQIREGVRIGNNCVIGKNVYIDSNVKIGKNVKIQNNSSVYHGVSIEDGVFIGPHVTFTNDVRPRSIKPNGELKTDNDWNVGITKVKFGASIGAGSVILPNITIGKFALIGAGSVVTKNISDHTLVSGNPARSMGRVCKCGNKIKPTDKCSVCSYSNKDE